MKTLSPNRVMGQAEPAGQCLRVLRPLRGLDYETGWEQYTLLKGMILAQNERWQRALYMQVERETPLRWGSRAAEG